jgi:hypothetical protein
MMIVTENHEKSKDEEDLKERSTKKHKENNLDGVISMDTHEGERTADINKVDGGTTSTKSYRGAVVGVDGMVDGEEDFGGSDPDSDNDDAEEIDLEGIRVEDQKIGNYDCPIFVLSKAEEKRIHRPWKRGVIVKLLGRRIGYKALETRLKQMWVKKGIINIIDLGNDYYLVTFSHDLDHDVALTNGPWFIYDHYLTVKEWSPNFHPQSDTIKKVAVWVRISGLPIEYYDSRVLRNIGNKIGSTVKVDKNTVMQEKGKYARLCVEVDLTKPLLAMFMIKERKYNVEYEGLHLLCKTCGRFGHYSEGCPEKSKMVAANPNAVKDKGDHVRGEAVLPGNNIDGPWMVVQKQKRNRKNKEKENMVPTITEGEGRRGPTRINAAGKINGSRFGALMDENVEDPQNNTTTVDGGTEPIMEGHVAQGREIGDANKEQNSDAILTEHIVGVDQRKKQSIIIANKVIDIDLPYLAESRNIQMTKNKNGNGGSIAKNGDSGLERINKENKLATRGGGSFKNKTGAHGKKGVEGIVDKMGVQVVENLLGQVSNHSRVQTKNIEGSGGSDRGKMGSDQNIVLGPKDKIPPNIPRPPDWRNSTTIVTNKISSLQSNEEVMMEGEVFEDANDQSSQASLESDMEYVEETPPQEQ